MGLDVTHDAWHGACSAFMRWRTELAKAAGLPPLDLMEGFYDPRREAFSDLQSQLPIKWDCLKPSSLHTLLHHSDCEGDIPWQACGPIADELEALLPKLPNVNVGGHIGNWRDKTATFIKGLRAAYSRQENLEFH